MSPALRVLPLPSTMKIVLTHFRCHLKQEFTIPNAGLVLLSGASGAGKTTILNAVAYALYGKLTKPYAHYQKECSVSIQGYAPRASEPPIDIHRSSPGSRLRVDVSGQQYEDEAGQGIIDNLVGTYEQFMLSAYVVQRLDSSILSLCPRDQVQFIKTLAGVGDAGADVRRRVKEKITSYRMQAAQSEGEELSLDRQRNNFSLGSVIAASNPAKNPREWRQAIEQLETTLKQATVKLSQVERAWQNHEHDTETLAECNRIEGHLRSKREQRKVVMQALTNHDHDQARAVLHSEIARTKRTLAYRREQQAIDKYQLELDKMQTRQKKRHALTPADIKNKQAKVETLKIELDTETSIAAIVADAKTEMQNIREIVIAQWHPKLKAGSAALYGYLKKQHQAGDSHVAYKCPACNANLVFNEKALCVAPEGLSARASASSSGGDDDGRLVADCWQRYSRAYEKSKQKSLPKSKRAKLEKKINGLESSLTLAHYTREDSEALFTSEQDISARRHKARSLLAAGDEAKLPSLLVSDQMLEQEITEKDQLLRHIATKQLLDEEIATLSRALDDARVFPDDFEQKLETLKNEMGTSKQVVFETQNALLSAQKALTAAVEHNMYERRRQQLVDLEKQLALTRGSLASISRKIIAFERLATLCKKADMLATDESIAQINSNAALYTAHLFEEQIQVILSRVRTTQKGQKRDVMNTNVVYKGLAYDNLEQLSGGERQRCNLAFILAVNDIVGCPLLLLDECLNNLDRETHASILVFLRSICAGKLVLVVAHEASDALFDDIVDISKA